MSTLNKTRSAIHLALLACLLQAGICLVSAGSSEAQESLQQRTGIKRSHLATWFVDTKQYEKYVVDICVQRMDLTSEYDIEKWRKTVDQLHDRGKIVFGVLHPLTHVGKIFEYVMDDPGIQSAACLDFNMNPIVTSWMKGRQYKGKPIHLYCGNHPRFRAWLRQQAFMIAEIGADGYHVDDFSGGPASYGHGGCFCEYCMEGFRRFLREKYTPPELQEFGIEEIAEFNYRDVVLQYADDTDSYQRARSRGEIPLMADFHMFLLQTDAALFESLREMGSKIRGKYMPMGWDNVQIHGSRGPYYDNLDIFYAEMDYHQFYLDKPNEQQDFKLSRAVTQRIAPAALVPHKFTDAIDKWYVPTPSPWSWSKIKELGLSGLLRQWIAVTYANGGLMRYPWKGWCFGETSRWFYPKQENYEPLYAFIRKNPELFDDYEAVEQVGVLYTHFPLPIGHGRFRSLRSVCGQLVDANVPFGMAVAGDEWLSNRLQKDAIDRFELMLIPQPLQMKAAQKRIVDDWKVNREEKVVIIKDTDDVEKVLDGRIERLVSVENNPDVWLFPRKKKNNSAAPVVCHVINKDYDDKNNVMNPQSDVRIHVSADLLGKKAVTKVKLFTAEQAMVELPFKQQDKGIQIILSELVLWGVLTIE